jgi:hypothetical protein
MDFSGKPIMSTIKKTVGIITSSFLIFVAIACLILDQSWSDRNIEISQNIGDDIAIALDNYFKDNSRYPDSLSSLVPKYLQSIHQPVAGDRRWVYFTYKDNIDYYLGFVKSVSNDNPLYMYPSCRYVSKIKQWRRNE